MRLTWRRVTVIGPEIHSPPSFCRLVVYHDLGFKAFIRLIYCKRKTNTWHSLNSVARISDVFAQFIFRHEPSDFKQKRCLNQRQSCKLRLVERVNVSSLHHHILPDFLTCDFTLVFEKPLEFFLHESCHVVVIMDVCDDCGVYPSPYILLAFITVLICQAVHRFIQESLAPLRA